MTNYTPELGQTVFGQPWQKHAATDYTEYMLDSLHGCLDATMRYIGHDIGCMSSPFSNSGSAFWCPVFGVWAYQWGDDPQPCNFYHVPSKVALSWYKYYTRGLSSSVRIGERLADKILLSCMQALVEIRCGKMEYRFGGLGEIPYPEELSDLQRAMRE